MCKYLIALESNTTMHVKKFSVVLLSDIDMNNRAPKNTLFKRHSDSNKNKYTHVAGNSIAGKKNDLK
jgi:hypothetical protein